MGPLRMVGANGSPSNKPTSERNCFVNQLHLPLQLVRFENDPSALCGHRLQDLLLLRWAVCAEYSDHAVLPTRDEGAHAGRARHIVQGGTVDCLFGKYRINSAVMAAQARADMAEGKGKAGSDAAVHVEALSEKGSS